MKCGPIFHFPKFFTAVSKQYIATEQVLNLEPCTFFELKKLIFRQFSKICKFTNPSNVIRLKLGQKGAKFVCHIPTMIKKKMAFPKKKKKFYGFVEVNNSFLRAVYKNCDIPNPLV